MAWCIDLEALDEAVSPRDRLISISVAPCQHFLFYAGSVAVLAVVRTMRSLLGNLFGLRQATLHFAQLVCRQKDTERAAEAGDSHPLHSDDGCIYQEGICKLSCIFDLFCSFRMNLPADNVSESCIAPETGDPRTHAAYLYLHGPEGGDFRGGDFFFASQSQERVRLRPAAGRMVAIAASSSNLHGVEHLEAGTRCHVGVWVAADSEDTGAYGYQRYSLQQAESILSGVFPPGSRPQVQDWRQEASSHQQMCAAASNVKAKAEAIGNPQLQEAQVLADLPGPQILRVGGFLSAQEAQHIIALAKPMLKEWQNWASTAKSPTVLALARTTTTFGGRPSSPPPDGVVIESGQLVRAKYRTSQTAWLEDEDPVLRNISKRIEDFTGLSLQSAEKFQVAHYTAENQGSYEPHFDWGTEVEVTGAFGTPEDSGGVLRNGHLGWFLLGPPYPCEPWHCHRFVLFEECKDVQRFSFQPGCDSRFLSPANCLAAP
eukprot:s828_g30.t3